MAQGSKKVGKREKKATRKTPNMKKGARAIAPKKASAIQAQKTYQSLEKAIKSNIEQEMATRAKAHDQNLKVVNIKPKDPSEKKKTTGRIIKTSKA